MDYKIYLADIVNTYINESVEFTDYDTFADLEDSLFSDRWLRNMIMENVPRYTSLKHMVLDSVEYLDEAINNNADYDAYDIGRNFLLEDWNWFDKKIKEYVIDDVISETVAENESNYERAWAEYNDPEEGEEADYSDMYDGEVELSDEEYDEGFDESLSNTAQRLREEESYIKGNYSMRISAVEFRITDICTEGCGSNCIYLYFNSNIIPKYYNVVFTNHDTFEYYSSSSEPPTLPKAHIITGTLGAEIVVPLDKVPEEIREASLNLRSLADTENTVDNIDKWYNAKEEFNKLLRHSTELKEYIESVAMSIYWERGIPYSEDPSIIGEDGHSYKDQFDIDYIEPKEGETTVKSVIHFKNGVANIKIMNFNFLFAINDILEGDGQKYNVVELSDEEYDEGFDEAVQKPQRRLFI